MVRLPSHSSQLRTPPPTPLPPTYLTTPPIHCDCWNDGNLYSKSRTSGSHHRGKRGQVAGNFPWTSSHILYHSDPKERQSRDSLPAKRAFSTEDGKHSLLIHFFKRVEEERIRARQATFPAIHPHRSLRTARATASSDVYCERGGALSVHERCLSCSHSECGNKYEHS